MPINTDALIFAGVTVCFVSFFDEQDHENAIKLHFYVMFKRGKFNLAKAALTLSDFIYSTFTVISYNYS